MMSPQRLVDELNALHDKYLSLNNFELSNALTDRPMLKMIAVTLANNTYCLLADLTGYPEQMPDLYVLKELRMRDGSKMGASGSMHCLGTLNGRTQICLGRECCWSPSTHFHDIYIKGKLWLEGYENYLRTGQIIATFLKEQNISHN